MGKTKVLITVKTHPSISAKYGELVCTAGFLEDGSFIRIYPVPFRGLKEWEQYKKYEWIELDLTKNTSDFRPESYRPTDLDNIGLRSLGIVKDWTLRRDLILGNVRTNFDQLIAESKQEGVYTSLAVFKPGAITGFHIEKAEVKELSAAQLAAVQQSTLFDTKPEVRRAKQLPFDFFYTFTDDTGKARKLKILDWEIGALFWNCLRSTGGDAGKACAMVRAKYTGDFMSSRDVHFYLGTIKAWQLVGPNPFSIIGVFYPPVETQQRLFVPEIPPVR
jgi:hypothetical protein